MYRTSAKSLGTATVFSAALLAGCTGGGGTGMGGQEGEVPPPPPPADMQPEQPPPGQQQPDQMDPAAAKKELQDQLSQLLEQRPLTFQPDSDQLTPEAGQTVPQAAELMKKAPEQLRFKVAGYAAQSPGSTVDAKQLSQQRADTVAEQLKQAGVPAERLEVKGLGHEHPKGDPEASRRVEIMVK